MSLVPAKCRYCLRDIRVGRGRRTGRSNRYFRDGGIRKTRLNNKSKVTDRMARRVLKKQLAEQSLFAFLPF